LGRGCNFAGLCLLTPVGLDGIRDRDDEMTHHVD
jgi:hypothetical protein